MAVLVRHRQIQALASLMLVEGVVAQILQRLVVQAALAVVVMVALTQALTAHQGQPTQAVVLVAIGMVHQQQAMAVPALSFCLYQQPNIRELLRVLRRSQQAGQIQF